MSRNRKSIEEKKPSLTININENLLKKVDDISTKKGYKRSKLIEKLLFDYVNSKETDT